MYISTIAYIVTLDYKDWCWEQSTFNIEVDEKISPIIITQKGYSMQYETSHDTLVVSKRSGSQFLYVLPANTFY